MKLKDFFDEAVVRSIAADVKRVWPALPDRTFVRDATEGFDALELTPRGWHVAEALRRHLPERFPEAADVLVASLGPELDGTEGFGMGPFRYMPHVFYVAKYGLDDLEPALAAQHALTKRFSAEFSIRSFLVRHFDATYDRLHTWATDPNVHVRRLVSEGTRPRLPWAPRLRAFQDDPRLGLELLELLKDDPERYVQRSVANHLNDISKDHPELAAEVGRRWLRDASPDRTWIVHHALRSLIKRGHPTALETVGFAGAPRIAVSDVTFTPNPVRRGDTLVFSVDVASDADEPQQLLVDFGVHFVKANGSTRPKVFKLTKLTLPPRGRVSLTGRVRFRDMTTRKHHPGKHHLDLRVNGVVYPLGDVDLLDSSGTSYDLVGGTMATRTTEKEIEALEQRFWKALQDHDIEESVALTEFPLLLTGGQGASRIERETFEKLSREATWDIRSFDLSQINVRIVNDDLALVAYHVHEDLTVEGGEPVSFDAADASVWIRRDGRWKCAMHTESVLGDPYGRDKKAG